MLLCTGLREEGYGFEEVIVDGEGVDAFSKADGNTVASAIEEHVRLASLCVCVSLCVVYVAVRCA